MKFFLTAAALNLKRLLRRKATWVISLLLLACCVLLAGYQAGGEEALRIRVGVVVSPGDPFGDAVYRGLERFESPIAFERYTPSDLPRLEGEIRRGRMECAFVFSPDLADSLQGGIAQGGITLVKSPRTVVDAIAGELLYASVLWESSPKMAAELLTEILALDQEEAAATVERWYLYYENNEDIFLRPVYEYEDGSREEEAQSAGRFFHGVIALFLLAGAIYALPPLIGETPSLLRRMTFRSAALYDLGLGASLFVTGMLQALPALLAVGLVYPGWSASLTTELGWLAAYQLALSFGATAAALFFRKSDFLYGGGVFLLLLTAVFGGVVIDSAEISRSLAALCRIFPSAAYIGGVTGSGAGNLLALLLPAGICFLLTLLLTGKTRRAQR